MNDNAELQKSTLQSVSVMCCSWLISVISKVWMTYYPDRAEMQINEFKTGINTKRLLGIQTGDEL